MHTRVPTPSSRAARPTSSASAARSISMSPDLAASPFSRRFALNAPDASEMSEKPVMLEKALRFAAVSVD